MGEILTKTYFSPQMYHLQLNYAFLLFWIIFVEIHRELHFLVQKCDYIRKDHWNTQNFLNMFEKGKILRKI